MIRFTDVTIPNPYALLVCVMTPQTLGILLQLCNVHEQKQMWQGKKGFAVALQDALSHLCTAICRTGMVMLNRVFLQWLLC